MSSLISLLYKWLSMQIDHYEVGNMNLSELCRAGELLPSQDFCLQSTFFFIHYNFESAFLKQDITL